MNHRKTYPGPELERLFLLGTTVGMTDHELLETFVTGEEAVAHRAFEVIVERHGPMVKRVSTLYLHDPHAAEDAFQATFLVLARRARVIVNRDLLGHWLYGVASRTARKSKRTVARRRARESQAARERAGDRDMTLDDSQRELERILHEEIANLPDSYRSAVVSCYLQGLTQAQAARQLQLTESTVRGRLVRARELLHRRLTRRGVELSTALPLLPNTAVAISQRLPVVVVSTTARLVMEIINPGHAMPSAVSATVQRLASGVLFTMEISSFKSVTTAIFTVVLLIGGGAKVFSERAKEPGTDLRKSDASTVQPAAEASSRRLAFSDPVTIPTRPPEQPTAQSPAAAAQPIPLAPELIKAVAKPILRAIPLAKDCMVLSYLPDWALGNVDNIGLGNNNGGVRTLVDWPEVPQDEAISPDKQFLLAFYSRQTNEHLPAGPLFAFAINENWPELTSWRTKPAYSPEPAATYAFVPGTGWKIFDITPIIRAEAKAGKKGHGVVLRFLNEEIGVNFSDYQFVSREATGEWVERRPALLIVDSSKQ